MCTLCGTGIDRKALLHYTKNRRRHYRIDGSPPEVIGKDLAAHFRGWGGYFFFMLRAVKNSPIMLMMTSEKLKRFSYVTNCMRITPFQGG